jgi:hypothetical protein
MKPVVIFSREKITLSNGEVAIVTLWHIIRRKTEGKRIAGTCSCADWDLFPVKCPLAKTPGLEAFQ